MRLTETSDQLDALAHSKHWDLVAEEADATSAVTHDGDEHLCFENGFDLAMKVVQMSALAKYAGKEVLVFVIGSPDDADEVAYFLAADEDEIRARLLPLEDKPAPSPDETEQE